jgi:tripartite-type tricarboxylate transporter receptor subunit TctC
LTSSLGQPVVVGNRAGAGGVGSLAVNPHIVPKISYDALKDFIPVVLLASAPSVVAVSPKVPFKTVQEMTAYAKANPGRINFASNGNGSSAHIATALCETMAGVDMTHVPYKGLAPAMTDLMSGQVDIMFSSVVAITPQIKSGKLRALAATSAKRSALLPDLPTLAELGLTGYEASSWYGLLVPAGTPEAIVRRLNAESVKALRGSSVRDSLSSEGAEVVGSTPEEFARHIRAEHARIGKMIKDGRLKMEP